MKQTFQNAAKFLGLMMIVALLSNTVFAQSSENTQKTLQATGLSATPVVEPFVSTPVYHGGTAVNSNAVKQTTANQTVSANGAAYMNNENAGSTSYKTANGITTVNADGSVVITSSVNGYDKTTVISKPVVNLSQPMGYEMDAYIANYSLWMKSNPDFKKFISSQENGYILQDDLEGLYKSNFILNQKLSLNK